MEFHEAYLLLGSSMGDRIKNCNDACSMIAENNRILERSQLYESAPWGGVAQNPFLNQVIHIQTASTPRKLLIMLSEIEHRLGRKRFEKWEDRLIDIDILYYEDRIIDEPDLKIPHSQIPLRRFTLEPLCDIASGLIHPVLKKTQSELLQACEDEVLVSKV